MNDNVALSFIMLFIEGMVHIVEQNTENDTGEHSAPPHSTPVPGDVSAAVVSAEPPSPLPQSTVEMPAHLKDLTDRASGYVEAASSANTRRAYASDWKHFTAWCRRQDL